MLIALQVLVTGSLYLVGDVLKLLNKAPIWHMHQLRCGWCHKSSYSHAQVTSESKSANMTKVGHNSIPSPVLGGYANTWGQKASLSLNLYPTGRLKWQRKWFTWMYWRKKLELLAFQLRLKAVSFIHAFQIMTGPWRAADVQGGGRAPRRKRTL